MIATIIIIYFFNMIIVIIIIIIIIYYYYYCYYNYYIIQIVPYAQWELVDEWYPIIVVIMGINGEEYENNGDQWGTMENHGKQWGIDGESDDFLV